MSAYIIFNHAPYLLNWFSDKRTSQSSKPMEIGIFSIGEAGCINEAKIPTLAVLFEKGFIFSSSSLIVQRASNEKQ